MKRFGRRLRRLAVVFSAGALLLLVLGAAVGPALVRRAVMRGIRGLDARHAAVEVSFVTTGGIQLAGLELGEAPWLRVAALRANYDLRSLRRRRATGLEVTGAEWLVRVRDGAIDWGPSVPPPAEGQPALAARLPFDRLELRASTVRVVVDGAAYTLDVSGSMVVPEQGAVDIEARLEGLGVRLDVQGTFDPASAALDLSFEALVDTPAAGAALGLETAGLSTIRLAGRGRGRFRGGGGKATAPWQVDLTDLNLRVERGELKLPGIGLTVTALGGEVPLSATIGPGGVTVRARSEGSLAARSVRGPGFQTGPITVACDSIDGAPLLRGRGGDDPAPLVVSLGLRAIGGVSLRAGGLEASAGHLAMVAGGTWRSGSSPAIDAEITMADAAVEFPEAALVFSGISATVPLALGAASAPGPGRLEVEGVRWNGTELPGLRGTAGVTDGVVAMTAQWPVLEEVTVNATGEADLRAGPVRGEMRARIDPTAITDPAALAALFPALASLEVTGTFSLQARATLGGAAAEPPLTIACADGRVAGAGWSAEGISGSVALEGFDPPASPGGQQVRVERVRIGELEIDEGRLAFTLEGPGAVLVEGARWTMGEMGRFRTTAFRFDPAAPVLATELLCEDMDLGAWLGLLTRDRATGEGRLYGRVPVTVMRGGGGGATVALGEGFLYARPGTGWIQVHDARRLGALLEASDPRFATDQRLQQIEERLIDALEDFEYAELRFDFVREADGLVCRAMTRGKGRRGEDPQEIANLTVNIRNLDELINDVLFLRSVIDAGPDAPRGSGPESPEKGGDS